MTDGLNIPKALITYFSGTGNSFKAASLIFKELEKKGYAVHLKKVEIDSKVVNDNYDLSIFIYPVYACRVPGIMVKYLNNLIKVKSSKAVIVSIIGNGFISLKSKRIFVPGYEGQALVQAEKILRKKGYDVFLTESIGYPANVTNFVNPPTLNEQEILIKDGDEKVNALTCDIVNQVRRIKKCNLIVQFMCWIFGLGYENFGRRMIGKLYVSDNSCNGCEKCKDACPANAIKMFKRKPVWNYNCEGCVKCINMCPLNAIQVSIVRLITFIGLFFVPYMRLILHILDINLKVFSNIYIIVILKAGIWSIGFFITAYVLDKLFVLFERMPLIRNLFYISYTRKFRRYLESTFNP